MEVSNLKRKELQKLCKTYKLKATGKNTELIERLQEHFESLPSGKDNQEPGDADNEIQNLAQAGSTSSPSQKSKIEKEKVVKKQNASGKHAVKEKANKKKKRKGKNEHESDSDNALTDGISDEKHKQYIKAKSASNSSQESASRIQSVGSDNVFIPGKLAVSADDVETNIVSPSLSQRLSSTDGANSELKVAMISPLVRGSPRLNSTSSLDHAGQSRLLVNNSPSVVVEDCQRKLGKRQQGSYSLEGSANIDKNDSECCYDLDDTVSYDEDHGISDAPVRKSLGREIDETVNDSGWLLRGSCLEANSTVIYSDCDQDSEAHDGSYKVVQSSNPNETFDVNLQDSTLELEESGNPNDEDMLGGGEYINECSQAVKSDDVLNRRQTHVVEKACIKNNLQNIVKVQGNDRRRTFQITMVQNNTAKKTSPVPFVKECSQESSDDNSFVSCKSTESEEAESSSLFAGGSDDSFGNRAPDTAQYTEADAEIEYGGVQSTTENAVFNRNCGGNRDRRGTYLIRSSEETGQENSPEINPATDSTKESLKVERSLVNHCVCHGTVRQSRGWRRLVLKRGLPTIQLTQTNLQKLVLKPAEKPVPIGYKDNMICGECVAENDSIASQDKTIDRNPERPAVKKVLGQVKLNGVANRGLSVSSTTMKRKWNENHACESSPATKKSKNSKTGAEGASCGLPASPEVRRARGEKSRLPRHLLEPFKPKRGSLERKEDLAYARKVEEIMMSVQPGSEEEMALIMQKKSRIPERYNTPGNQNIVRD
ncbi:uncharacterized protein LOC135690090 [Rhopilema esculentum]|uniref:uncharacterized protein LOC135690090 n=1 Tax=Rhopilema esculentum TaxID=499914 RepID=UPI0031D58E21|eukprot:gene8418-14399_t